MSTQFPVFNFQITKICLSINPSWLHNLIINYYTHNLPNDLITSLHSYRKRQSINESIMRNGHLMKIEPAKLPLCASICGRDLIVNVREMTEARFCVAYCEKQRIKLFDHLIITETIKQTLRGHSCKGTGYRTWGIPKNRWINIKKHFSMTQAQISLCNTSGTRT